MRTAEDLVSVVIPVYNTAPYLERCITSILENTYQNLEIICINDGSIDNSLEILYQLATKDARIHIITKENGGVSSARNLGLDIATGEYVCFIDSDDWIHREFFSVLLDAGKANDGDIIIGNYVKTSNGPTDSRLHVIPPCTPVSKSIDDAMSIAYFRNTIWGRIYKRSCLVSAAFPLGINMAEDQIFNTQVISQGIALRIVQVDAALYFYYERPGSAVHSYPEDAYLKVCRWYLENMEKLPRKNYAIFQAFRSIFIYRYEGSFSHNKREIRRNAKIEIHRLLKCLWKEENICPKDRIKYSIFALSPAFYRLSLIARDRTMLEWEKVLKERTKHQ